MSSPLGIAAAIVAAVVVALAVDTPTPQPSLSPVSPVVTQASYLPTPSHYWGKSPLPTPTAVLRRKDGIGAIVTPYPAKSEILLKFRSSLPPVR